MSQKPPIPRLASRGRRQRLSDAADRVRAVGRAVSPVIGLVIVVVVVILLSAMLATAAFSFEDRLQRAEWDRATENPWAEDPLLGPENPVAGAEDVRYRVYFEVGENTTGPLNTMTITVETDVDDMFSGTEADDLETFNIVWANESTKDLAPYADGWNADETSLTIHTEGGAHHLEGDEQAVEIIFGGVDNPATAGTYDVEVQIGQGNISAQQGELEIIPP